jgi:hypothetical protein
MTNPTHTGDTITKVLANTDQVRALAQRLLDACDEAAEHDEVQHVESTFEQSSYEGPWRIRFDIVKGTS